MRRRELRDLAPQGDVAPIQSEKLFDGDLFMRSSTEMKIIVLSESAVRKLKATEDWTKEYKEQSEGEIREVIEIFTMRVRPRSSSATRATEADYRTLNDGSKIEMDSIPLPILDLLEGYDDFLKDIDKYAQSYLSLDGARQEDAREIEALKVAHANGVLRLMGEMGVIESNIVQLSRGNKAPVQRNTSYRDIYIPVDDFHPDMLKMEISQSRKLTYRMATTDLPEITLERINREEHLDRINAELQQLDTLVSVIMLDRLRGLFAKEEETFSIMSSRIAALNQRANRLDQIRARTVDAPQLIEAGSTPQDTTTSSPLDIFLDTEHPVIEPPRKIRVKRVVVEGGTA